ncbi:hypothetical protein DFH06DRAFT_1369636 [Mycena polygramma]|nr:hypothetical protein DFH06DRAFT_1369636 [Mycena polygramma]
MATDNQVDEETLTPNDRLINTLEKCFSDLMHKQEEQADKFNKALEALKPTPPVTDKKIAFWNAYKTLSDEHDKEFHQKYSTDLDTSLIFAGLFSAVDSAFIIQIQPDIQPHGTPLVILVAQNLLYVSLFSTLLAALLAVLGKQWLMYYMAAGERGTIEARGLERQRKFDGLRKWKFDAIMQMFPLLLQLGLFLFSAALSIYLWKIHLSLAVVVLSFTSIGATTYTILLMSAVAFPDSPFQTPLAPLVARLWTKSKIIFSQIASPVARIWIKSRIFFGSAMAFLARRIPMKHRMKAKILLGRVAARSPSFVRRAHAGARHTTRRRAHNLLPFSKNETPEITEQPSLDALFKEFPTPSPEVPAVSWVLETSTDPRTVAAAAEMVIELQWPWGMDVAPQLSKLRDGLLSCFLYGIDQKRPGKIGLDSARDGMSMGAVHLGQAYCTLRCVLMSGEPSLQRWQEYWCFEALPRWYYINEDDQLRDVRELLAGSFILGDTLHQDIEATGWVLNVVPGQRWAQQQNVEESLTDIAIMACVNPIPLLDRSMLADYLFSIVAFFSPINRGSIWRDKG